MIKTLWLTELEANRKLLLLSAIFNAFFVLILGVIEQSPLRSFIGVTVPIYFVHLLIMTVRNSDERRMRLYAQLPLTAVQIFWASWLFCLAWLGCQVAVWILYGFLFDQAAGAQTMSDIGHAIAAMVLLMGLVSIGIDLFSFKPGYWFWSYLFLMAALLALSISLDLRVGLEWTDSAIALEPFADLGATGLVLASLLAMLLVFLDRSIYKNSENYLF